MPEFPLWIAGPAGNLPHDRPKRNRKLGRTVIAQQPAKSEPLVIGHTDNAARGSSNPIPAEFWLMLF